MLSRNISADSRGKILVTIIKLVRSSHGIGYRDPGLVPLRIFNVLDSCYLDNKMLTTLE